MGKNIDIEDLVHSGYIGLIIVLKKYDSSKTCNFSSYATPWIKSKILKTIYCESRTIRLSEHYWNIYFHILNTENELSIKLNRKPTILEIANFLKIPVLKIQKVLNYYEQTIVESLDSVNTTSKYYNELVKRYLSENEELSKDDISLEMFTKDNKETAEDIFNNKADKQYLLLKIKKLFFDCNLTEREREVLMLKYGFNDSPKTLKEIGQLFGVSKERIKQIKEIVFNKIRYSGLLLSVDTFLDSYDEIYYNLEEKTMN